MLRVLCALERYVKGLVYGERWLFDDKESFFVIFFSRRFCNRVGLLVIWAIRGYILVLVPSFLYANGGARGIKSSLNGNAFTEAVCSALCVYLTFTRFLMSFYIKGFNFQGNYHLDTSSFLLVRALLIQTNISEIVKRIKLYTIIYS